MPLCTQLNCTLSEIHEYENDLSSLLPSCVPLQVSSQLKLPTTRTGVGMGHVYVDYIDNWPLSFTARSVQECYIKLKRRGLLPMWNATPTAALVSGKCHPLTVCCSPLTDTTLEQNSPKQAGMARHSTWMTPLPLQCALELLQRLPQSGGAGVQEDSCRASCHPWLGADYAIPVWHRPRRDRLGLVNRHKLLECKLLVTTGVV